MVFRIFEGSYWYERRLTFVSYRNHGILEGVKNVFSDCYHGFCFRHLTGNLKDKFKGTAKFVRENVLKQFAGCAYAALKPEFDKYFTKLTATGGIKIQRWLEDIPKEHWSNAYFEGPRFGQMTSNGVESWNSQIRDKRVLPITRFLDAIRILLMEQMASRRENTLKWTTVLCKHPDTIMNEYVDKGRQWFVVKSTDFLWEVFSNSNDVVDVQQQTCSCRLWQIIGLPCIHAALVIVNKLHGRYDYISEFYHLSAYKQTYAPSIAPFVQPATEYSSTSIQPPVYQAKRGKPKRNRIQSKGEKVPRKIRCGRCGQISIHNRASCTNPINV